MSDPTNKSEAELLGIIGRSGKQIAISGSQRQLGRGNFSCKKDATFIVEKKIPLTGGTAGISYSLG
jgi:hypothetical protein